MNAAVTRLREWRWHPWTCLAARLYLGVVFGAACAYKIAHPESFAVDVATYGILPLWAVNAFAIVLPWVEAAAAVMLVLGFRARAGALLAASMMVMFMVALGVALAKGLDMSCGCFASASAAEQDPIGWTTMLRDSSWLALAVYVAVFDRRPIGLDAWIARRVERR